MAIGVLFSACVAEQPAADFVPVENERMKNRITITIVYDNNRYDSRLTAAWGFSCLARLPQQVILFDTGGDGVILLHNMAKLKIDPGEVDVVVLSHVHGDHVGGLASFLEHNSNVTGCAHPGIVNVAKKAGEITGEKTFLMIGGFHLGGASPSQISYVAESLLQLGVEKVAPCHCSGERARRLFSEYFGDDYIDCGVGKEIVIE